MESDTEQTDQQIISEKPQGMSVPREKEDSGTLVNGISNGYSKEHKSEHKDKHRDKDKHKDKHRSDRDKHHSDKDRHKHSSSKSSHKDKHRDKDSERDGQKESSSSKDKERDKHRDKDKERKHKDEKSSSPHKKEKEHSSSKEHKSSSKDKDREHKSGNKEHKSEVKDKDREHKSSKDHHSKEKHSSSSKDKHHSSSKDKHRDKERNKDKDKPREKDRDKERSKSDHHKNKDRDGERKEKEREKEKKEEIKIKEEFKIKEEMEISQHIKEESMDESQNESADETLQIDEDAKKDEDDSQEEAGRGEDEEEGSEDETPLALRTTKTEEESEEDVPLMARVSKIKREANSEDEYKPEKKKKKKDKKRKKETDSEDEEDFKPAKKRKTNTSKPTTASPTKKTKKEEEENVWKWWEEGKREDGKKWTFLEHKGPVFAAQYEPLPKGVRFYYDGKEMRLSEPAEEVATFYARMLTHDYTSKDAFNKNFFNDWRKMMTHEEKKTITELKKCNFKDISKYFEEKSEERKAMSKEEKKKIKEQNEAIQKEYGFCTIDGHQEKIGNFRIEPPGLFRGRGEHPKMGMLKKRVMPEDVIVNCSKDSQYPTPPRGHKWKEVRHDNSVTWLASWTENVQGNVKYVMLNPSSKLKGEKDMVKYETARKLAKKIDKIRENYIADWKSKEMRIRQRAVALYFIDRLALRAGNEKDEDQADTVGCCSLRVEHVALHEELNGKDHVVVFDFLGKDSIRYYNEVPVEKRVFKNLQLFMENKKGKDDLFDRLNTTVLNQHLHELMDGLTAKVFRTYNASWTLQQQLDKLTNADDSVPEKILAYNRANRAVAILCNHQRSVPKGHEKSMDNLKQKIEAKRDLIADTKKELKTAEKHRDSATADKKKKQLQRLKEQLVKLEIQETDKEENKSIALGTSKLNYLDPRISVAWCKKYDVPIEKIYSKTHRDKFRWAIDMAGPDYVF